MNKRSKTAPCDYCMPLGGFGWGSPAIYDDGYMSVRLGDKSLHIEFDCKSAAHAIDVEITNCPMCGEAL